MSICGLWLVILGDELPRNHEKKFILFMASPMGKEKPTRGWNLPIGLPCSFSKTNIGKYEVTLFGKERSGRRCAG